ncbi:MAG: hypothetical protein Q8L48_26935 [Archangium sp.]|nr:hypothetical protein [Archangium sp.]
MRKGLLVWCATMLTLVLSTGCECGPGCPEFEVPPALAQQPLGGPCDDDASCLAGLQCLPSGLRWKLCSTPCGPGLSCPAGARGGCFRRNEDAGTGACEAECLPDGGCVLGALFGRCFPGSNTCGFINCRGAGSCPEGAYCAGVTSTCHPQGSFEVQGGYCRVIGQ